VIFEPEVRAQFQMDQRQSQCRHPGNSEQDFRVADVCFWPIAPFRFDLEFGRYRGIADDGPELPLANPVANDPQRSSVTTQLA
jgi:hypothetical protein